MADQIASTPPTQGALPEPVPAETAVSAEEYMAKYAHDFYEWVNGQVVKMAPISERHDITARYYSIVFESYFALSPIGVIREAPFVLRMDSIKAHREPDLQIILHSNPGQLTKTAMIGAADICIEIVSLESVERDYGKKFEEYEAAGVKEYWIADPIRHEARFHRLNAEGLYQTQLPNADDNYQTPLLPGLVLHVADLWLDPIPNAVLIVESVKAMLKK